MFKWDFYLLFQITIKKLRIEAVSVNSQECDTQALWEDTESNLSSGLIDDRQSNSIYKQTSREVWKELM